MQALDLQIVLERLRIYIIVDLRLLRMAATKNENVLENKITTAVVSRILTNYLPQFRDLILFISTTE